MDKQELIALLAEGLSLDEVARRLGRAPSTVSYWLRRYGLRANGSERYGPKPALDEAVLRTLIQDGHSVPEIARRLGCTPGLARRALRRLGVQTRQEANRTAAQRSDGRSGGPVELRCRHHGVTPHVLEGRGAYRCMRCRSDQVIRHRRQVKRTLIEEAGGGCVLCGYDRCHAALQFHHVDPWTKSFELSQRGLTRSWARMRAEAAKCVLLCATCHAEVEAGFSTLPLPGSSSPGRTRTSKP